MFINSLKLNIFNVFEVKMCLTTMLITFIIMRNTYKFKICDLRKSPAFIRIL